MTQKTKSNTQDNKEEKIDQHKKSTQVSSSKIKDKDSASTNKHIQKTVKKHDDWNDPTGNSHIA
jgi:hypothetical protein